jgi:hypothetical protein
VCSPSDRGPSQKMPWEALGQPFEGLEGGLEDLQGEGQQWNTGDIEFISSNEPDFHHPIFHHMLTSWLCLKEEP